MNTPSPAFSDKAYSVVHVGCATGYYSFAHEMGHNEGCQHYRNNANGQPGAFPFSYGYQRPNGTVFRTIMAYQCTSPCVRLNRWSNPDLSYQGVTTGVADNDGAAADNAKTLNNTRTIVAQWRKSLAKSNPNTVSTPPPGGSGAPAETPVATPR